MPRLPRQLESLARMLTYMLGHRPDEFGLVLDDDGFVPLKQLHRALAAEPGWGFVRRHHLEELVALATPSPFEIRSEEIRALIPRPARLRRPPGEAPPALLYLAIPPKAHHRVWEEGLKPLPGRELLLATGPELALRLGRRRSPQPVLITVQAQAAARAGIVFQGYGAELYLAPALPREFLQMPAPPQDQEKSRPSRPARPQPVDGAFRLDLAQMLQEMAPKAPLGPFTKGGKTKRRQGETAWKAAARTRRKKRPRQER